MRRLLCKAIVRMLILYLYGLFIAWIFTMIEKLDETAHQRMERMLKDLRNEVDLKYNMTDNEFNSSVKIAAEARVWNSELARTRLLEKKGEKQSVVFQKTVLESTLDYGIEAKYEYWICHFMNGLLNQ